MAKSPSNWWLLGFFSHAANDSAMSLVWPSEVVKTLLNGKVELVHALLLGRPLGMTTPGTGPPSGGGRCSPDRNEVPVDHTPRGLLIGVVIGVIAALAITP